MALCDKCKPRGICLAWAGVVRTERIIRGSIAPDDQAEALRLDRETRQEMQATRRCPRAPIPPYTGN